MKFIEKYRQVLVNISFASKLTSLLMFIFVFTELCESFHDYFFEAEKEWINENWNKISIYIFFLTLLAIIFSARFILLWFKESKFVWLSQITWLLSWLTILSYNLVTNKIFYGGFFESRKTACIDCYNDFLWASVSLVQILMIYLLFSPIKQILVLAYTPFSELEKTRTKSSMKSK